MNIRLKFYSRMHLMHILVLLLIRDMSYPSYEAGGETVKNCLSWFRVVTFCLSPYLNGVFLPLIYRSFACRGWKVLHTKHLNDAKIRPCHHLACFRVATFRLGGLSHCCRRHTRIRHGTNHSPYFSGFLYL